MQIIPERFLLSTSQENRNGEEKQTVEEKGKSVVKDVDQITSDSVKQIGEGHARAIYEKEIWNKMHLDVIQDKDLREQLFDAAIHHGQPGATRALQRALNAQGQNVTVDGGFGEKTLEAVNKVVDQGKGKELMQSLLDKRKEIMDASVKAHPEQEKFYNGWMNRLETMRNRLSMPQTAG